MEPGVSTKRASSPRRDVLLVLNQGAESPQLGLSPGLNYIPVRDLPQTWQLGDAADDSIDLPFSVSETSVNDKELASECILCNTKLGKRHWKPRHHCRVCFQAVCAACSPNWILLSPQTAVQRVCVRCGETARKAPAMRGRLEKVAESIRSVCGPTAPTFGEVLIPNRAAPSSPRDRRTLDDAVDDCEMAASSLLTAFNSHENAKAKIDEVETEAAEQREKCERLEAVAQRVEEVEALAADERQTRLLLQDQISVAQSRCSNVVDRVRVLGGSQVSAFCRDNADVSLEDAFACCDSELDRLESMIVEERRAKNESEEEGRSLLANRDKTIASLQAEVMKLRADLAQEQQSQSTSYRSQPVLPSTDNSCGGRTPHSSVHGTGEDGDGGERVCFRRRTESSIVAPTPPRLNSVRDEAASGVRQRQACYRAERCAVM